MCLWMSFFGAMHQYETRINHNVAVVASASSLFNVNYERGSKHIIRLCFDTFFL